MRVHPEPEFSGPGDFRRQGRRRGVLVQTNQDIELLDEETAEFSGVKGMIRSI